MKPNVSSLLLCAGLCMLPAARSRAALTVNSGDLIAGFFQVSADGTTVEEATYVYNLGAAATWRENTATSQLIENINTDLTTAFGADWHNNPQVRWGIVGVVAADGGAVTGDPTRTTYFSQALTAFAPKTSAPPVFSSNQRGSLSNAINSFRIAIAGRTTGASAKGAVVSSSVNDNYTSFLPPVAQTSFGVSTSPNTTFTVNALGTSPGAYDVEAALDVYRVLHSGTGADLTAGLASGNAAVGTGQYIGTFTLDAAGNLRLDARTSVVPSGYEAWADANGLTAQNRAADLDADADGIGNGVEFVIGGNPTAPGDEAKLPVVSGGAGIVEFTFRRADASASSSPGVEQTADPAGAWTPVVNGQGGVTITEENDFFGAGFDRVTVKFPVTGAKGFARLTVTIP